MTEITFDRAFEALTGHSPLRWQRRLFDCLYAGKILQSCDIPTGLGKTSVIPIWLIALSQQADRGKITLPRRLAYIINRRTVVDQATNVVKQIRSRLLCPAGRDWVAHEAALRTINCSLQTLASGPPPLAVSTLRGELADNEEWKQDPARAAIIVGTIDMIGSKLLFSGYGDGHYHRAHHAGLIGQDTLIIHDEAHLTPAFSVLLRDVKKEQRKDCEPRPIHVMELSATQRSGEENDNTIRLEVEDERDDIVVERIDAIKRMRLHGCDNDADTRDNRQRKIQEMVDLACCHNDSQARVLIYVRTPKDAQDVESKLRRKLKADQRIALLTGTIRGYERDNLERKNHAYKQFLHPEDASLAETVYLISTSAGEVGIDIDADHMVCDMTTLDSMIQRLGRVNRRGGTGREARVDVVWTSDDENEKTSNDKAVAKTLAVLRRWMQENENGDSTINVSPRSVRKLIGDLDGQEREESFSPIPAMPPLSDILLDAWSLTSVNKMPGRPEVAGYLHGLTNDPPTTYIVWREELSLLSKYDVDKKTLHKWFHACPVRANERLQMRTYALRGEFGKLTKKHRRNTESKDCKVVLLDERNQAEWSLLSELGNRDADLEYKTIVLPPEAGGLGQHGVFDSSVLDHANDVADSDIEGGRRVRQQFKAGIESPLVAKSGFGDSWKERERVPLTSDEDLETDEDVEENAVELVLRMPEKELAIASPANAKMCQTLAEHTDAIMRHMKDISERLQLKPYMESALVCAARWHDQGKDRDIWQRFACNDDGAEPLAKSTSYRHGRMLSGYRHEFGSLLDAMNDPALYDNPERELVLHLIAAHHGHARPHFDVRAIDKEKLNPSENNQANVKVMQDFGRLQNRFGRWGLAWLESLLRCADAQASQPEE